MPVGLVESFKCLRSILLLGSSFRRPIKTGFAWKQKPFFLSTNVVEGDNKTMSIQVMTPAQIRLAGLAALARELGPVGMVRFLQ